MRIIGLTGGIACGKSNVSETLAELGACIIDGDRISRDLTQDGGAALPAIRKAFGDRVFRADGTLDRKALGTLVFQDDKQLKRLNALMHPMIIAETERAIKKARAAGFAVCVLDMPLLYEAGLDRLCDTVWCVWIPEQLQIERLTARDGLTEAQARARIQSQMPTDEKKLRAAVVIDTSSSISYTKSIIPALYEREIHLAAGREEEDDR